MCSAYIEYVVVAAFTVEYLLRFFCCHSRLRFVFCSVGNVVDLLSILPFYIELLSETGSARSLQVFRLIRLVRIFRLFRMSRYSTYMQIMLMSLQRSADAFGLLFFCMCIALIISASLMYYAERGSYNVTEQVWYRHDGLKSQFTSIPVTFWWAIQTIITVG